MNEMTATSLPQKLQRFFTNLRRGEIQPIPSSLAPIELLASMNGWRGMDEIDRPVKVMRCTTMVGPRWHAAVVDPKKEAMEYDPRSFDVKRDEIHPDPFAAPCFAGAYQAWATFQNVISGGMWLRGCNEECAVVRKLAFLAAMPAAKVEDKGRARFMVGDCLVVFVRSPLGPREEAELEKLILSAPRRENFDLPHGCGPRMIIIGEVIPQRIKNAIEAARFVEVWLSGTAARAPRKNVPLRRELMSTAMLLGQCSASRDDIAVRGGWDVFIREGMGWRKANASRFMSWLNREFDFIKPGSGRRCNATLSDANAILHCEEFLSRLRPFQLRPFNDQEGVQ